MPNILQLETIINDLHEINMAGETMTAELVGPPGCAKTSFVKQWARKRATDMGLVYGETFGFKIAHVSTEDPMDTAGVLHIDEVDGVKRAARTYPNVFPQPWEYATGKVPEFGVLLMDEWGQGEHDQHKAYATAIDERRLGKYHLPDGWIIILTSNRVQDKSGVMKPLAFITTRKIVIDMEYNSELHVHWLESKGIHYKLRSFVQAHPGTVQADVVPEDDLPYSTSRTFFRACLQLQQAGVIDAIGEEDNLSPRAKLVRDQIKGTIGQGPATRLFGHLRYCQSMTTMKEILENPARAPIPERPDVMWAVVQMMATFAKEQAQLGSAAQSLMPMFKYMKRMPENFQMSCVRMIAKANKKLLLDKQYADWVRDNRELILAAVAAENHARGR